MVEYHSRWPEQFEWLAAPIRVALGTLAVGTEQVGGTSVPGLAAKPVIDLDVVIASRVQLPGVLRRLSELGYRHRGNLGIPGREAFHWVSEQRHHLYVCSVDTPNLHQHLLLRDYLRVRPDIAAEYGALKKRPALIHRQDQEAYTEAKSAFIGKMLLQATRDSA